MADAGISRDRLVRYLDEYLRTDAIPDKSPNGLQVQGAARIEKIAFGVDAGADTIRRAARAGANMLIVHHGLWWGRHEQIVGNMHKRIAALIRADMSLYTAHLPLDCHPEVGNNAELARLLGLAIDGTFADYGGVDIGVVARSDKPMRLQALTGRIKTAIGVTPDVLPFGPGRVSRVAILSGGGAMHAEEARDLGCHALFTGESAHSAYHAGKEAGINLIYGGHYATETVGLKALDRHLKKQFRYNSRFIDVPTGY